MEIYATLIAILESSIRLCVPLVFACLAGLWSERSGVVDIGLEGKMLIAAFASAAAAGATNSAMVGLSAGIIAAVVFALIHGFAAISQRGNQIVSGVAINMLAAGLTALVGNAWYNQGGRTTPLEGDARFLPLIWPGADALDPIPIIGPIYAHLISGHSLLTYFALVATITSGIVLRYTRFGLRIRAVGENPAAVDTAGVSVTNLRYAAVILAGVLCGFAGSYLALGQAAGFLTNMTAGKGFIALAALIFAKWRAWPALWTCFLFGLLDAVAIRLQGVMMPGIGQIPVQAIQALPYLMTVVLLAGFIGKAIPPKASGLPYVKER
ncbi:MAG: ABC transporter permease [Hyphomicrobiales bacterium]|nr:ABC transporter permease [Hyphomicrobiales bacterium]